MRRETRLETAIMEEADTSTTCDRSPNFLWISKEENEAPRGRFATQLAQSHTHPIRNAMGNGNAFEAIRVDLRSPEPSASSGSILERSNPSSHVHPVAAIFA